MSPRLLLPLCFSTCPVEAGSLCRPGAGSRAEWAGWKQAMGLMKLPDGAFSQSLRKEEQVHVPAGGGGAGEIGQGNHRDMFLKSSPPFLRAPGLQSWWSGLQDATPGGKTAGASRQMQEFLEPLVKKPHGEGAAAAGETVDTSQPVLKEMQRTWGTDELNHCQVLR